MDTEDHLWEVDITVVVVLEEEVDMEEVDSEDEEDMGEDVECRVIGGYLPTSLHHLKFSRQDFIDRR